MIPKIDVTTFLLSVSQAGMQALHESPADLSLARQNIDLLEMMEEKTRGNLTGEESNLLTHLLFQLRMSYIQAEKK